MSDPVREFRDAMQTLGLGVSISTGGRTVVVTEPPDRKEHSMATSDTLEQQVAADQQEHDQDAEHDDALFDSAPFEVKFPRADGRKVDEIAIKISGTIVLDRNSQADCDFVKSLHLGDDVELRFGALVRQKGPVLRKTGNDDDGYEETVSHVVALKAHSLTIEAEE